MPGDEIRLDLPQIGDELLGQYEILAAIPSGNAGILLRARQKSLRRTVVVKIRTTEIHEPSLVERFLREARAVARISEPHVVCIHDCGLIARGAAKKEWSRAESAGLPF